MNRLFRIAFIVTVFATNACSKNNSPAPDVVFPVDVKATKVESRGTVSVFTKDGEVTDVVVVAAFIADADGFGDSFQLAASDAISFLTDSIAGFGYSAIPYKVKLKIGNTLVFSQLFSFPADMEPLQRQFGLDHFRIAKTNLLNAVPTATGFTYMGEEIRIAEGDYTSLLLPVTVYKLSRRLGHGEGEASHQQKSRVFSPFNEAFLETLGERDTIAYQQRRVRFEK